MREINPKLPSGPYTLFQNGRHFSILLFPSKLVLMASLSSLSILLNFMFESEAIRANLHGKKRILKWRPFWNKVYAVPQVKIDSCIYSKLKIMLTFTLTLLLEIGNKC